MSVESLPEKIADMNSIYFLRNQSGSIPIPANLDDAGSIMPVYVEIGYLSGHVLLMLEQVLSEIYLPILTNSSGKIEESEKELAKDSALKADLVISIQKFATQVSHFSQQVTGGNRLNIPQELYSLKNTEIDEAAKNTQITKKLEVLAEEWIDAVSSCLLAESKKEPVGNGALAEIDFWRDRYTSLSALYEQLNVPIISTIISILNASQIPCSSSLEFQLSELTKSYTEAKDNVKFLSTLERHFKNIVTGSLVGVLDGLPSLMNAIRMVWIISRHYNRDERMVPLMARIAWEISNKVSNIVDVKTILREDPMEAKRIIVSARNLLEGWSKVYDFQINI
jgi:dynein heavy chain